MEHRFFGLIHSHFCFFNEARDQSHLPNWAVSVGDTYLKSNCMPKIVDCYKRAVQRFATGRPYEKQVPLTQTAVTRLALLGRVGDVRPIQRYPKSPTPRAAVNISGKASFTLAAKVFGLRGHGMFHGWVSRSARQLTMTPTHHDCAAMAIHSIIQLPIRRSMMG